MASSVTIDTISSWISIDDIIAAARINPANISFTDLRRLCDHLFGAPRQQGTIHRVYKMPWQGDPRINIQKQGNKAKAYQVKQVLKAIDKLEREHGE